jgi:hypothetical protein
MGFKKYRRIVFSRLFPVWERMGFHVTRVTYNYPITDTRLLKQDLWEKRSELLGIDINETGQIDLLAVFSSKFKEEYSIFPLTKHQFHINIT